MPDLTVAVVDNDVLKKGAGYGLLEQFIVSIPATVESVGLLAVARFVIRKKLRKAGVVRDPDAAVALLERIVAQAQVLEPTAEESAAAAELEYQAQQANLPFDAGESQLCAIVLTRRISTFVTGDKRAIAALDRLLAIRGESERMTKRVLCLEQLLLRLLRRAPAVRDAVCQEPRLDTALTLCFSCSNPDVAATSWTEGLNSYVGDVRRSAPLLLADD